MPDLGIMLVLVICAALAFDYINGFHDTANAIATVVSTRVLSPRTAIIMSATLNFVGALVATHVAKTIASGLVEPGSATNAVVLSAILAGIVWNLITWYAGIPSSSSHALIGGLTGAALLHGGAGVVKWDGLLHKVVLPLVGSPLAGYVVGYVLMLTIYLCCSHMHPGKVGSIFRRLQIISSAAMALSHGQNDAQKSMGVITLALFSAGLIDKPNVPIWVILACATAMASGTSAGGWRIIKTMGHRIIRLEPVNGFAAETTGAIVISAASFMGMPVSTTHVISGSIFGVGSSKRFSAVRWPLALNMVAAWVITLPASAAFGAGIYWVLTRVVPG